MTQYVVSNLPVNVYPECRKIILLHDLFSRGIDPFWTELNPINLALAENKRKQQSIMEERRKNPKPRVSANMQDLYILTRMIQEDIFRVTQYRPTGHVRRDTVSRSINDNFLNTGIDNYAVQLEIFINSLIIDDGWTPDSFQGFEHTLTMLRESTGLQKMNYLQILKNKISIIIPLDVSTTDVKVIEPSISKSSNTSDG